MNIDRVRSFYDQRPVRPFTIHRAWGENNRLRHPGRLGSEEKIGFFFFLPVPASWP